MAAYPGGDTCKVTWLEFCFYATFSNARLLIYQWRHHRYVYLRRVFFFFSFRDGIAELPVQVSFAAGCGDAKCETYLPDEIKELVQSVDITIVCLGTGKDLIVLLHCYFCRVHIGYIYLTTCHIANIYKLPWQQVVMPGLWLQLVLPPFLQAKPNAH